MTRTRPSLISLVILLGAPVIGVATLHGFKYPPAKPVIKGEWQLSAEKAFDEQLVLRETAITTWAVIQYGLFHEGRKGVLPGLSGWLYSDEEFAFHRDAEPETARKLDLIRRVKADLDRRHITLIIALIPDKSRVYPEFLGPQQRPSYVADRYENFRQSLEKSGINAPDLLQPLLNAKAEGDVFLHTDTHWTPLGAQQVAKRLAEALPADLPGRNTAHFVARPAKAEAHRGDLGKFVPLGPLAEILGVPDDQLQRPDIANTDSSTGLLDEVTLPGALVGTSYSANVKWGFADFLKLELGADIVNAADEGKGPVVPLLEYLASDTFRNSPPQFIIWDIPERFLPVTYDISKFSELPALKDQP